MSFFAWQRNKIILFYFTKNSVSEIDLALVYREAELLASGEGQECRDSGSMKDWRTVLWEPSEAVKQNWETEQ